MNRETPAPAGAVHRYFEVSLFLLLTVGFLALASTGQLDVFTLVVVTAALVTKALRYRRHREPELTPEVVTGLTWFYFAFYLVDFFLLSDSFLVATTHLVLFIALVKLFSARSNRDYLWLALIAFLEILAAATLTVNTTFLVFFFLFLVTGISTFVSYEIKRGTETAQTAPLPAGSATGRRMERSLLGTSVTVAVATLVLAALFFFTLPRVTAGYMSSYGFQPEQISGFSDEVSLGEIGSIKQNPAVVMRVRTLEGDPQQLEGLKWRGMALDGFAGDRWFTTFRYARQRLRPVGNDFSIPLDGLRDLPLNRALVRQPVRYRVLLEPISTGTLFAAAVPTAIDGRFRTLWIDGNGSISYFQSGYGQVAYDVVSDVGRPAPEALRAAPTDYPRTIQHPYLDLPSLDPRVADLGQQLTLPFDNPYDKARELERYFRTQFGYTLELLQQPVDDPIAHFLFVRREGHCEYFASAMTVLLRSQGIPTRIVNGFLSGEYNEVGENYIVRAQDAHTWVEVYFPGLGWVDFDPTPPDPNPRRRSWWTTALFYLDAFDLWWDEWVINYDFFRQVQLARSLRDTLEEARTRRHWLREKRRDVTAAIHRVGDWVIEKPYSAPLGVGLLLAVLLLWRGRQLSHWLRGRWVLRGAGGRSLSPVEATFAYERLLSVLRRKGYRRESAQTPLEFATALRPLDLATTVGEFTHLYNQVRFGQQTAASQRLLELLRRVQTWKPPA